LDKVIVPRWNILLFLEGDLASGKLVKEIAAKQGFECVERAIPKRANKNLLHSLAGAPAACQLNAG